MNQNGKNNGRTPESIRQHIEGAKVTSVDRKVLNGELDRLLNAKVSLQETSDWIDGAIEVSEATMAERTEVFREVLGEMRP